MIFSKIKCIQGDQIHTEVAQSCLTLCEPIDCSPPGSSVHGIFQAWILEWVAISTMNIHWKDDAEAEAPTLWPPNAKSQLIRKDPDAGKDWGQEEKGMTEDETVGWHHWLDGHEFEQALGMVKDRDAWHAAVYGVTKSQTWLSKQQPCLTSHNCFFSHHQVPIKRAFVRFCWEKMTNTFWKS